MRVSRFAVWAMLAVAAAACRRVDETDITVTTITGPTPTTPTTPTKVDSLTVSPAMAVMNVGQTLQFMATVYPLGINPNVSWRSSDTSVATIDPSGKLTARKVGQAVVIAISLTDPSKFGTASVTVVSNQSILAVLAYGGDSAVSVKVGQQKTLPVIAVIKTPNGGQRVLAATEIPQYVVWGSTNLIVLSVDPATGVMTGRAVGSAQIFAAAKDDPNFKAFYGRPIQVVPAN